MATSEELTREYAQSVAETIDDLRVLGEILDKIGAVNSDVTNYVRASLRSSPAQKERCIQLFKEMENEPQSSSELALAWLGYQLEVTVYGAYSFTGRRWTASSVDVLITVGGPKCSLNYNLATGDMKIEVLWSSSAWTVFTRWPALVPILQDTADEADGFVGAPRSAR